MPIYGKKNEFGNLLVKVDIVMPEHLNEEEMTCLENWQQ